MQDKVSIITPSWNSEKYIKKTIESVQNQTYLNWEMIIVDDCSSDNTVKIVQELLIWMLMIYGSLQNLKNKFSS